MQVQEHPPRLPSNSKLDDINIAALSLYVPSVGSGETLDDAINRLNSPGNSTIERELQELVLCGRNGWYMRWTDGSQAWDNLPQTLHHKIISRSKLLPGIINMSVAMDNSWLLLFRDGSFTNSGFPITPKLAESLFKDSPPVLFTFAPAGGWVLVRDDGSVSWDKLPTTLNAWLLKRTKQSPKISRISISSFGGWFVMTADKKFEWEGLPSPLAKLLILETKETDMLVTLSLSEGNSYFIYCDDKLEWAYQSKTLAPTLQFAHAELELLPDHVTWEQPIMNSPSE